MKAQLTRVTQADDACNLRNLQGKAVPLSQDAILHTLQSVLGIAGADNPVRRFCHALALLKVRRKQWQSSHATARY